MKVQKEVIYDGVLNQWFDGSVDSIEYSHPDLALFDSIILPKSSPELSTSDRLLRGSSKGGEHGTHMKGNYIRVGRLFGMKN